MPGAAIGVLQRRHVAAATSHLERRTGYMERLN